MAKQESVFIFIGTYPDEASAQADYQVVKDLHSAGAVGTYDAAVVTKDADGKVHENKDEMPTRHGAWGGAAVGLAVQVQAGPGIGEQPGGQVPVLRGLGVPDRLHREAVPRQPRRGRRMQRGDLTRGGAAQPQPQQPGEQPVIAEPGPRRI